VLLFTRHSFGEGGIGFRPRLKRIGTKTGSCEQCSAKGGNACPTWNFIRQKGTTPRFLSDTQIFFAKINITHFVFKNNLFIFVPSFKQ